ncbi:MAG: B12-binding domain-containing radical SAM protein [Acidobacteriota bacterium]
MHQHPKGTQARILLSSVFGPYAQDDEFGSRAINPMELYHNQVTREQGPFSLRLFHRSWGIMFIQHNISAPCAVLDFPTRERFVEELKAEHYDIVGLSGIIVNVGKIREMCRLVREHSPDSTIVVGGHVTAIPGIQHMIDADHIVKGEGVSWFRSFLGEDPGVPVNHPVISSSFGFSIMGLSGPQGGGSPAATIIPSVGCPMGCNFCTTSAFFGGKGKVTNFFEKGAEIFHAMSEAEAALGVKAFFVMDENFLLYKERAMELLEQMKAKGKAWSLYVFSSANAIGKYKMRELVELGVAWIWMGLEAKQSGYSKLQGADTVELTKQLQAHGIGVLGSTIVGLEHHTPENIQSEIEHAVAHDTDFHQFMLYTPVPGTPLYEEMASEGRLIDVDLADIHGQDRFNFEHAAIPRDSSKRWLDWAFRYDFEKNGPSVYRLAKTMMEGWKRYHDDPDPRVRERHAQSGRELSRSYGAALFAMEKYLRDTNSELSQKIRALRKDMEHEFGALTRWMNRAAGPVLLWTSRRDARKYPRGKHLEPITFLERRNWPEPA